jgi:nucleoside-diphosphate-sugar epimerase
VRFAEVQAGDVRNTSADTDRAREVLGFVPRTSFADGLGLQFEWVRGTIDHAGDGSAVRV